MITAEVITLPYELECELQKLVAYGFSRSSLDRALADSARGGLAAERRTALLPTGLAAARQPAPHPLSLSGVLRNRVFHVGILAKMHRAGVSGGNELRERIITQLITAAKPRFEEEAPHAALSGKQEYEDESQETYAIRDIAEIRDSLLDTRNALNDLRKNWPRKVNPKSKRTTRPVVAKRLARLAIDRIDRSLE